MYTILATNALVLAKRGVGESGTLVSLFTRERGLLRAMARNARAEHSKLRYVLEPCTAGRFSLVEGAHEWRVTGASHVRSLLPEGLAQRRITGRVQKLLLRLIAGEEAHPELFDVVTEGLEALCKVESEEAAQGVECTLILRSLYALGYLPRTEELAPFLDKDFFDVTLTEEVSRSRKRLVRAINDSLQATGL